MKAGIVQNIKHIEISVCYETEKREGRTGKLISVSRSVTSDGKEIYKDKMESYDVCFIKGPITKLGTFSLRI